MQRMHVYPRDGWYDIMQSIHFEYCCIPSEHEWKMEPYWQEKAIYVFNEDQIDTIQFAANNCYEMMCGTMDKLVEKDQLGRLGIHKRWHPYIKESWNRDYAGIQNYGDPSMIGRFDFSWNGQGVPKLLEFNGDTPTSLFEAGFVQWHAMEDRLSPLFNTGADQSKKPYDQFNLICEKMLEYWTEFRKNGMTECHFTSFPNYEDMGNAVFAMKYAQQAGIKAEFIATHDIGYDQKHKELYGEHEETIKNLYKLWPFEYWIEESSDRFESIINKTNFVEPLWKMAFSTKAMLPLVYENFKDSPYLLPAYFDEKKAQKNLDGNYAKKPFISREGQGVTLFENNQSICESEDQPKGKYIYQGLAKLPQFYDQRDSHIYCPVIGTWMIGGECWGMGVRENKSTFSDNKGLITDNNSLFAPHIFIPDASYEKELEAFSVGKLTQPMV